MIKRTILATAVAALTIPTVNAAPFQPMDARGIAMGNTGVASAKRAHAPAYNPSLLAQEFGKDGFAILLPQVGVAGSDEGELSDTALDIADEIFPRFEDAVMSKGGNLNLEKSINDLAAAVEALETTLSGLSSVNPSTINSAISSLEAANSTVGDAAQNVQKSLAAVDEVTKEMTGALKSIDGHPLAAKVGLGSTIAIPSKTLSMAISVAGNANISARVNLSDKDGNYPDLDLLEAYNPAASGYVAQAQNLSASLGNTLSELKDPNKTNADKAIGLKDAIDGDGTSTNLGLKSDADNLKNYNSKSVESLGNKPIISGGKLTPEASNPNLESTVEVVAVAIAEVGLSFASEFEFGNHPVAIGITPKIQKISTFHYGDEVDGFEDVETDDLKDYQRDYTDFNLDIGASYRFGASNNWMAGAVVKNILGGSYKYADTIVTPKDDNGIPGTPYKLDGGKVNLNPQVRGGIAYHSKWFNAAFDLDLMKNKAVAYEAETQYASLGIELDVFRTLQLRAGYRANLVSGGTDVVTAGFGLSPFGVHIDVAAMANPSDYLREAGAVMDLGFYF